MSARHWDVFLWDFVTSTQWRVQCFATLFKFWRDCFNSRSHWYLKSDLRITQFGGGPMLVMAMGWRGRSGATWSFYIIPKSHTALLCWRLPSSKNIRVPELYKIHVVFVSMGYKLDLFGILIFLLADFFPTKWPYNNQPIHFVLWAHWPIQADKDVRTSELVVTQSTKTWPRTPVAFARMLCTGVSEYHRQSNLSKRPIRSLVSHDEILCKTCVMSAATKWMCARSFSFQETLRCGEILYSTLSSRYCVYYCYIAIDLYTPPRVPSPSVSKWTVLSRWGLLRWSDSHGPERCFWFWGVGSSFKVRRFASAFQKENQ